MADGYYYSMEQDVFDKKVEGHEGAEYYKARLCRHLCQQKIGLEKFKADMAQKAATVRSAKELHYMNKNYGSPANALQDANEAKLLVKMEEKAVAGGFQTGLEWDDEQPDGLDSTTEPYGHVLEVFR